MKVRGPPDPLRPPPLPGPGIDPQGPGITSPGHPEQFPDRRKIAQSKIKYKKLGAPKMILLTGACWAGDRPLGALIDRIIFLELSNKVR